VNPLPFSLKKFTLCGPVAGNTATRDLKVRHCAKRARSSHAITVRSHIGKVTPEMKEVDWLLFTGPFGGAVFSEKASFL
jgi:acetate kinase